MQNWFDVLTMALYGNAGLAFLASLAWGILSIVISPCHLSSIPIVVAFINNQQQISTKKAFKISLMFSIGIMLTLLIAGAVTSVIGILVGSFEMVIRIIISVLLIFVGLFFLDIAILPSFGNATDKRIKNKPYLSSLIMGLVFGVALGPCALAFMAPILGIVLSSINIKPVFCIGLVSAFVLGHCGILILAGTFTNTIKKYLNWNVAAKGTKILRKVCGVLIILGGVYTFVNATGIL